MHFCWPTFYFYNIKSPDNMWANMVVSIYMRCYKLRPTFSQEVPFISSPMARELKGPPAHREIRITYCWPLCLFHPLKSTESGRWSFVVMSKPVMTAKRTLRYLENAVSTHRLLLSKSLSRRNWFTAQRHSCRRI